MPLSNAIEGGTGHAVRMYLSHAALPAPHRAGSILEFELPGGASTGGDPLPCMFVPNHVQGGAANHMEGLQKMTCPPGKVTKYFPRTVGSRKGRSLGGTANTG